MKIGIGQVDAVPQNTSTNINNLKPFIKNAKNNGVDLLVLPELTTSGYYLNSIKNTSLSKEDTQHLLDLSIEYDLDIIIGVPQQRDNTLYNTLKLFRSNGRSENLYDKIHLFPGETKQFCSGSSPTLFSYKSWNLGATICYDLRFPELFSFLRSEGAHAIVVSAAWPQSRVAHWEALLVARAVETQCFIIAANRCGTDDQLTLAGNSMLISPTGEILVRAGIDSELLVHTIDTTSVKELREQFPFFNDRRLDLYKKFY